MRGSEAEQPRPAARLHAQQQAGACDQAVSLLGLPGGDKPIVLQFLSRLIVRTSAPADECAEIRLRGWLVGIAVFDGMEEQVQAPEFERQLHIHLGIAQHRFADVERGSGEAGCLAVDHPFRQIRPEARVPCAAARQAFAGEIEDGLAEQGNALHYSGLTLRTALFGGFLVDRLGRFLLRHCLGFLRPRGTTLQPLGRPRRSGSGGRGSGNCQKHQAESVLAREFPARAGALAGEIRQGNKRLVGALPRSHRQPPEHPGITARHLPFPRSADIATRLQRGGVRSDGGDLIWSQQVARQTTGCRLSESILEV